MTLGTVHRKSPAVSRSGPRGLGRALGLVLLATIPLSAGALRLVQLAGGPDLVPADPRFDTFPVALVLHILGSAIFALLGVLQFLPRFRRTHLTWHRKAGRLIVGAGLVVTMSAFWLTLFYDPQPGSGCLLFAFRLVFATGMVFSLVRGFAAVRNRDIRSHRAWMMRAYAIGLGAGTQILTEGFGEPIFGTSALAGDLEKGAGWVINLVVVEWFIRRGARTLAPGATTALAGGSQP